VVAVGTWLLIVVAFLADVASAPRGVDWLYRFEARRAQHARSLAAELRAASREARAHHARGATTERPQPHDAALLPEPAAAGARTGRGALVDPALSPGGIRALPAPPDEPEHE
jgi:hypothetical protein